MMFCRSCDILFDNERKRIEKCNSIGFERMLSVNR